MSEQYDRERHTTWMVGQKVREFRDAIHMSHEELAKQLGDNMTADDVVRIEAGKRRAHPVLLSKIATVLGVRVGDFFLGARMLGEIANDNPRRLDTE